MVFLIMTGFILIGLNIALFQKVLIFKIEVFATVLLAIHKQNVYRDNQLQSIVLFSVQQSVDVIFAPSILSVK